MFCFGSTHVDDVGNATTAFDVCYAGTCMGRAGVNVVSQEHTFNDLEIFTNYSFVVLAQTRIGAGPTSNPVYARTKTGIPSGMYFNNLCN